MKNTKICSKCKQELTVDKFYERCDRPGKYQSLCKKCLYQYQSERWINKKIKAVKKYGGQCIKCGYNKNYAALQFHHRNPEEKEFSWKKARMLTQSKIDIELEKCDLLCANCHAELHYPHLGY